DPYDIVATDSGKVVVSSGSGQWTYINAYQAPTGQFLGQAGIRQQSRLALHPNQQWVYSADTDLSPSDMDKFDISGPGITPLYEMAYHGDHRVWGNVYALPGGQRLVTAGGDVFTSSGLQAGDMQFIASLTPGFIHDLYVDAAHGLIFTLETANTYGSNSPVTLHWYNLQSLLQVGQQGLAGGTTVYVDAGHVYVIANGVPESVITSLAHPCPDCGSNTAPVAAFTVDPAIGGDTTTSFQFDATGSADAESGPGELLVRWDWESDGVWDTLFSPTQTASHRYILPGSYVVRLQVADEAGAVDSETGQVAVVQGIDAGTPVAEPGLPYRMDFVPLDAALAPGQGKLYLSAPGEQRVYVMDLGTGVLEKYFESLFIPERMAVTPAGDRLYLAQPVGPHSSYQFDEQEGYIAEFDLVNGTKLRDFFVSIDPYDLVVNSTGKLVISSGSAQWTDIQAYRTADGALVGTAFIRQQSRLALHPSGSWVYSADTDVSPSDIRKFDIGGAGIVALNDSPYHGDHRMSGNVYAAPSGTWLVTRGGDVFSSSAVQGTDMIYQGALTPDVIEAAAFDDSADRLVTIELLPGSTQVLRVYRTSDRTLLDEMVLDGAGIDVVAYGGTAYVVRQDDSNPSGGARVQVVPLP
ncbi:MAG: PKD domain-containing protein, partial [Gammaproteobacteria bacterium]|nr:PKD domain-containing protein [Gammaproteobacteria bacterium]